MIKKNFKQSDFISRIESELLSALFNYVAPFIDKKIKSTKKENVSKTNNLETIIHQQKPKIDIEDIKELEELLLKNLKTGKKFSDMRVSFEMSERDLVERALAFHTNSLTSQRSAIEFFSNSYSLSLRRQKTKNDKNNNYSISIKYEENAEEEKLKIKIQKDEKEIYSAITESKKDAKDKVAPYSVIITYEDNYAEERLSITYRQQLRNYMKQHIDSKEDMTDRVPLKWLNILPETMMGGVLGFTYLGENFMGRRADLTGKTARMVDIHESIHTPDEYETRVLTSWIMEKVRGKYVK